MKRIISSLLLLLFCSSVAFALLTRLSLTVGSDGVPTSGVYIINGVATTLTFSSCTPLTSGSDYDEQVSLGRNRIYSCVASNSTGVYSSAFTVGYTVGDDANKNAGANSGAVTTQETTRVASQLTVNLISTRISTILAPSPAALTRRTGASPPAGVPGPSPSGAPDAGTGLPAGPGQGGGGPISDSTGVLPPSLKSVQALTPARQLFNVSDQSLASCLTKNTGLAAGDEAPKYGFWGVGSLANMQDFQTDTRYEGNMYMFMGGFDSKVTDDLLLGVAAGYENTYLSTYFNQGNLGADGYTISPYAAYKFTDTTTADLLGGVTFLNYDTKRGEISGSYQAVRSMWSLNLNQYFVFDNWMISGVLGNMFANEHAESFSESDGTRVGGRENYLSELRLGGKVSYVFDRLETYAGIAYLYDYMMRYSGEMPDQDAFEGTAGLNYRPTDSWILGVEGMNSFDRAHTQNMRIMANIRYEF